MATGDEEGLVKAGEAQNRVLEADENLFCWRFLRPLENTEGFCSLLFAGVVNGLQGPIRALSSPVLTLSWLCCD